MNPLDDEVFAIAIAIAKQCFNGRKSLYNDRFPALGTDFLLNNGLKTADWQLSKWPPAVQNGSPLFLGWVFRKTGTVKWLPYGGSSLDD